MKRILTMTLGVLASMALSSCGDDCPEPIAPETPILFRAVPGNLTIGSDDKDAQSIFVTALNVEWRAEVEASAQGWLKITEESDRVSVRAEENTTGESRTGNITITPDHQNLPPSVIVVTQSVSETIRLSMSLGTYVFNGDFHECGISSYLVTLAGGEAEYSDWDNNIYVTNGYTVILDLLASDISHQDYRVLKVRTGTFDESMDPADPEFKYENWTLLQTSRDEYHGHTYWENSWLMYYKDQFWTDNVALTGGWVVVEGTEGSYHVTADLTTNRKERVVIEYSGPFDWIASGVSVSTYSDDRQIDDLSQGTLDFYGEDTYYSPETYSWSATLWNPDRSIKTVLSLYSPMTDSVVMDPGIYTIRDDYILKEYMVEAGSLHWMGAHIGTWIHEYDQEGNTLVSAPLIEGTVEVVHNGGNNYTLTIDAFMDNYYVVNAVFEGDLEYSNRTSSVLATGFAGVPYKLENGERIPAGKVRDRNTPRYSLGYTE